MALADELKARVSEIFASKWSTRDGQVVPAPKDLRLDNEAVEFERATILYADLSGSTSLVDTKKWEFSAEIYTSFLYCASRLINGEGGTITSYDGDRVMGVFVGDIQSSTAARCALKINYAVKNFVNKSMNSKWNTDYAVKHVAGIDTSKIRVARTGVRGDNDLVWVGRAANYAAKLTTLSSDYATWITKDVYDQLTKESKYSEGTDMWKKFSWTQMSGATIYGSTYSWSI